MIGRSTEHVVVVEVPLLTDFMGKGWIRVTVDADPGRSSGTTARAPHG